MNIFIDISVLTLATFVTGIQRVTREVILRLIEDDETDICLLHYSAKDESFRLIDNERFTAFYRHGNGIKHRMITSRKVSIEDIRSGDIWFDLDAAWMGRVKRSWLLPKLKQQGVKIVSHIYDIISITHPQYCLERGVYNFADYIGAHLLYDDLIIVNAEATTAELEKLAKKCNICLPECCAVPLGADFSKVNMEISAKDVSEAVLQATKDLKYILMVGTIEPRKNHKLVLDAYDGTGFDDKTVPSLKEQGYGLIIAGNIGWNMAEFEDRVRNHSDFGKGIYFFNGLADTDISYLYKKASYLCFASFTEGFGLPIIEALQRGTRVVCADVPVLREVGGDNCLWFKQGYPDDLASKIYEDSEQIQNSVYSNVQTCTWDDTTTRIKELLRRYK